MKLRHIRLAASLFMILSLILPTLTTTSYSASAASESITIKDPILENIVRSILVKPTGSITAEDAAKVTEIDTMKSYDAMVQGASGSQDAASGEMFGTFPGIQSLEGLQYFTNLTRLNIAQDYTHSYIPEHNIKDLAPLRNLSNLEEVTVSAASLGSMDGLQNLTKLKKLTLQYNGSLSDLNPLRNLTSLEELDLTGNHVQDLSPIGGLSKLRKLVLDTNPLVDVEPLRGLKNLTELSFSYLTIANDNPNPKPIGLEPLSGLTNLVRLNIEAARIQDLTPIASLSRLEQLDAGQNPQLIHPEIVAKFPGLTRLSLPAVGLTDVSPISGLTKLEYLDISLNQLNSIESLQKLTRLRSINAVANRISSINVINHWPELEYAYFGNNSLVSIEGLKTGPNLKQLDIENNIVDYREPSGSSAVIQAMKKAGTEILYTKYEPFPDILFRQDRNVYALGRMVSLSEAPFNKSGRFYVPLRFVSEVLGAEVQWNKSERSVTIREDNRLLKLVIGEKNILVNGKRVETDAAPMIVGGTTFVPVRFVSEQLGIFVQALHGSGVILKMPESTPSSSS